MNGQRQRMGAGLAGGSGATPLHQGLSRHRGGDMAGAERAYRAALVRDPASAEALHLLGTLAFQCGHAEGAVRLIGRSLRLDGRRAEVFANYGLALHALDRVEAAEAAYRAALSRRQAYPEADNSLGTALQDLGRLAEAEGHYRRALALRHAYPEALVNLGSLLRAADRWGEAAVALGAALALDPGNATAHANLGIVFKEMGRPDEAQAALTHALRLAPDDSETLVNLGLLRDAQGQGDVAEGFYARALEHDPDSALARWNLALRLLARGERVRGWALYESRFDSRRVLGSRRLPVPAWRGEALAGRRLLVWREQGLGDELMFGTLLPRLAARVGAGALVVRCDARLVPLLARSLPGAAARADGSGTESGREGAVCHTSIGSLPHLLGPGLAEQGGNSLPPAGWLVPDAGLAARWRDRLAALGAGLTVGICWRSGLTAGERRHAYTRLEQWGPLLRLPGVRFVCLQYDKCAAEVADAEARFGVTIHRWPDADLKNDLDTAAALTAGLDLVVTVATAVGEMAGALGVPVWRLSPAGDWTTLGTGCRPFFPAMRLWVARRGEPVASLLPRVAAALSRLAALKALPHPDPLASPVAEGWALIRAGRLPEAEAAFQRALAVRGDDAAALDGYAAVAEAAGRPDIAADLLGRAVERAPTADRHARRAAALQSLGLTAAADGDYTAAVALGADDPVTLGNGAAVALAVGAVDRAGAWLGRALAAAADWAGLHANRALWLHAADRTGEASVAVVRALVLDPALAEGWNIRASLALESDPAAALAACDRALTLRPAYPEASGNRGLALMAAGRADAAAAVFRAVLRRHPLDPAALANMAHALAATGQGDAAGVMWWRRLWLDPGSAEAFAGLADVRQGQNRPDAALRAWDRALTLRPERADWHYNRANALYALNRRAEADAGYRRAADLDPALSLARFNLGYAALADGRLIDGWQGLEARFAAGQARPDRRFAIPRWTGETGDGKRLLVWREQGVGDEIMFASCYPDLLGKETSLAAPSVVIEADPRLVPLFARSFPAAVVRRETAGHPDAGSPDADRHVPAGSLPLLHRRRLTDYPVRAGYLTADPVRVAAWRARLGPGLMVGICWRSGLAGGRRGENYTALAEWGPVLRLPGLVPVCLQYDDCAAELAAAEAAFGITIVRPAGVDLRDDLDGAAAVTAALDLVVSAGTSVAEMAAALGVPVWRLSQPDDWTALGTGCRPWYPTMRLFTRQRDEPMAALPRRVAAALVRLLPPPEKRREGVCDGA